MLDALPADASFVTVEPDDERYRVASAALAGTRTEVLHAGWENVLPERAPFDVLFFDVELLTTPETAAIVAVRCS